MHVKLHPLHENDCASCGMRDQSLFANLNSEDFQLINQPIHDLTAEAHTTLFAEGSQGEYCLLYTSPSPRDRTRSRMPSSA